MSQVKKIHYIWLGKSKKNRVIRKCIKSWKRYFPDWEIIEWNEDNLDLGINEYCRQAYNAKKYAFASDVLRFDILHRYGGLYFDVDVEVIKDFSELLENYEAFAGFENGYVAPGLVLYASRPGNNIIKEALDKYTEKSFFKDDGTYNLETVCLHFSEILKKHNFKMDNSLQTIDGFTVFPRTFFCPVDDVWSIQDFSDNTYTIHHYAASWKPAKERLITAIKKSAYRLLGKKCITRIKKIRGMR